MSDDPAETVIAEGEVPFVVLSDKRVVMARYRTTHTPQPAHSLSDPESTRWVLTLDGREFEVVDADGGGEPWVPMDSRWARGGKAPLRAYSAGEVEVVHYDYFFGHHLGWLTGPVTLKFDPWGMTVTVRENLEFDAD